MTAIGLRQPIPIGLGIAAVGGSLIYRGLAGYCPLYSLLDINSAEQHGAATAVRATEGFKVVRVMTVNRRADELYPMGRDFAGLRDS